MKIFFTLFTALLSIHLAFSQPLEEKMLEGINFRSVGPAGMSGRITAIDVVLTQPDHIYIGAASGGVWESRNGGTDWTPIFDDQPTLAIGAIKINQQNPSEIWVGTGEGNPRNSHNSGKGIFRSLDGGKSWASMGLKETKVIHRILIDPFYPSTIYAGAAGSAWGPNAERGIYKTTDSGKTWKQILYSNDRSGIADMVMDPRNPQKIIAALYEYGRTPWDYTSGGDGSGLYVTYDGGENWKKKTAEEGLPEGKLGRIGLAIAPSKPDIIYALVEAKENGLYKSNDGGDHWSLVSTKNIGNRPFYYSELYVDPRNENRIWNLYSSVSKSEDGGRTFTAGMNVSAGIHPDHHAFWISPDDEGYMIDGNDGGLNITRDGGENWFFCENIPVGQFYHISIDHQYPYNLYGGMQDNGSWVGPAYVLKSGGIRNADWRELYFGDGFDVLPKASDSRYGWAMSQGGSLTYYDKETGFNQFIKPVHPDGITLRFNWNAALAAVPGEPCGIYYGSQFVHRSLDCGQSWELLSPDLTTNDTLKQKQDKSGGLTIDATAAENHTTILCISPSAIDPNVIWVGTDDGNLQLTKDGGKTWNNLISRLPGCPAGAWIPQIEVSTYQAGEAFVTINNYRRNDWSAYAYHTTDFGVSWTRIANDQQITSFVQCITQDPKVPGLIFLGADDGLYVSTDTGKSWARFPSKVFPRVSTIDMKINAEDQSLAIATFGRALYVMDDLSVLRKLSQDRKVFEKPYTIFDIPEVTQASFRSVDGMRFSADAEFRGKNRAQNAQFKVYVKPPAKKAAADSKPVQVTPKTKKNSVPIEKAVLTDSTKTDSLNKKDGDKDKDLLKMYVISNSDTIRRLYQKLSPGWNTVAWDLASKGVFFPSRNEPAKDASDPSGEYVSPGTYKIVTVFNKLKDSTLVSVRLDPRLSITPSDLEQRALAVKEFSEIISIAQKAFQTLQDIRKDVRMTETLMVNAPDSLQMQIKENHKALNKKLESLETVFMQAENVKGYTNPVNLEYFWNSSNNYLNTSLGKPGSNAIAMINQTRSKVDNIVTEVQQFVETDWKAYQQFILAHNWPLFKKLEPLNRK